MEHAQSFDKRLQSYLDRVQDRMYWSQAVASRAAKNHKRLRVITAIGAVVIPIISNLPFTFQLSGHNIDSPRIAITVIGLFVALSIALEDVLKFRERWTHYSNMSFRIQKERQFYLNEIGEYANLDREKAFKQFVDHIESVIAEEDSAVLKALTQPDKK